MRDRGAVSSGVFFVLLGVVLLLDSAGVWTLAGGLVVPVLLVVGGAAVLAGAVLGRR